VVWPNKTSNKNQHHFARNAGASGGVSVIEPVVLGDCTLFLGDCLTVMQQLPDKSVDAVITDPPYNVGIRYGDYSDRRDDYLAWSTEWVNECKRISRGIVIFTIASTKLYEIPKPDWIGVWYKPFTAGFWNTPLIPHWEALAFYGNGNYLRSDVFTYCPAKKASGNGHPTPKPIPLFIELINTFTKENDIVLDPFVGSGVTALASIKTIRKFIGIDNDGDYLKIAEGRIKQAQLQMRMEL
jgi:DNA modification methylase